MTAAGTPASLREVVPRMKVAFVSFDFGEYCVRIAGALAREAEVLLLLPNHEAEPYHHLLGDDVSLRTFDKPRLRQGLRQIRTTGELLRRIRQFNPDLVHLQSGHLWFNFVLPLLGKYPLVLTVHDPQHHLGDAGARNTPQWVLDWGCRRARSVIVHAPQLKEFLVRRLNIPADAVHVIPHVLCGDEAAAGGLQEDEGLVLFFGRIWPYKGIEYLIRAEPMISARFPSARILIAGNGEDFARYRRTMVHPERFTIMNEYVSDETRAELFRRASVVVLPYVEASQSGVIPIAYRFGKPVVATTVGGLPAMVEHGRTGLLVPPRDENALADAVLRLLENAPLRKKMGVNGRYKVNTECAPDAVAQTTLAVYRNAATLQRTQATEAEATWIHSKARRP